VNVLVTDPQIVAAIKCGALAGTIYQDGDVYADETDLAVWQIHQESLAAHVGDVAASQANFQRRRSAQNWPT
jgi:hypothetical protein